MAKLKCMAFSDNHGLLYKDNKDKLTIKECDIILCAGDIFPLEIQRYDNECFEWLKEVWIPDMQELMKDTGAKAFYLVPGNHDFAFENIDKSFFDGTGITFLVDELGEFKTGILDEDDGEFVVTIWGSPWLNMETRTKWAFDTKDENALEQIYDNIPFCNILLTHCPPQGLPQGQEIKNNCLYDFGNKTLKNYMDNYKLEIDTVVCGHIHDGYHSLLRYKGIEVVNAAIKNDNYDLGYDFTYWEQEFF